MWLWITVALAGTPQVDAVRPALAPLDAPNQYMAWLARQGSDPDALACETFWPGTALLCYRVVDGDKLRWVTRADLKRWEIDGEMLRAQVEAASKEALAGLDVSTTPVPDMRGASYWSVVEKGGWAAAPLLAPAEFAASRGITNFLAVAPTADITLAWAEGQAELDKVMAVGAREMFEAEAGGVSPVVYRWSGGHWLPYAEAKERPTPPGP